MTKKETVIPRRISNYDPIKIKGIINPLFRLDLVVDAYPCLFSSWCRRALKGRF